jgi:hypothetical protein
MVAPTGGMVGRGLAALAQIRLWLADLTDASESAANYCGTARRRKRQRLARAHVLRVHPEVGRGLPPSLHARSTTLRSAEKLTQWDEQ